MSSKNTSWLEYINTLQKKSFSKEDLNVEGIEKILNINQHFHAVFNHSIPWIYLLDYTTGKYLLISQSMKSMLGHEPESFLNHGLGFTQEIYEKDHLRLLNEEIFPDRLSVLKEIPPPEHPNYIFSHNLDLKKRNGETISLLQRNCFIKSDEKGNPLLSFGVITSISHFASGNSVKQVVERISTGVIAAEENCIFKKSYFLNKEIKIFSNREKELLLWLADGLSSKEIAGKLFISEHTVINHRRNMMEKCSARNAAQLLGFALKNKII